VRDEWDCRSSRSKLSIAGTPLIRVIIPHAEPGNRGLHCALVCREPSRGRLQTPPGLIV